MKNRTLGLFIGSTQDSYGQALVRGACEAARTRGARLVVFTSGTIRSYHGYEAQRNVLFNLAGPKSVDALLAAGSLSHSIPSGELADFFRRYAPLPLVSLAVEIPGSHTVRTDNRPGMLSLMAHLMDFHGYSDLAFVGGPPGQQEADLRRSCFLEAHAARGLAADPTWMVHGDFTKESGRNAAARLVPEGRKPAFRGIVCANDSMALGVMEYLKDQGLRVPQDLAVTGFDDMEESRFLDPPLTTVRQSAYHQALEGAALALDMVENPDAAAGKQDLKAQAVIRRSCGCSHRGETCPSDHETLKGELIRNIQEDLAAEARIPGTFLDRWQDRLRNLPVIQEEDCLLDVLSGLQKSQENFSLQLYREAVTALTHEIRRQEAVMRFLSVSRAEIITSSAEELLLSHELPAALEILSETIPKLGFSAFMLSLFLNPEDPGSESRLLLYLKEKTRRTLAGDAPVFCSEELIPGGLDSLDPAVDLIVVEALHSKSRGMGFLVFGAGLDNLYLTGSLRSQISSALQGVLLLEDLRSRNTDLTKALDELKRAQDQLVLSEKMAALGNLVAGVAHEINTPLGVALTASSFSLGKAHRAREQLEEGSLKKSELEEHLRDLQESGQIIQANLQRAADLVHSFKQIASDQSTEHRRKFRITGYIKDILLSLAPQWKHRPVEVQVRGPDDLEVDSFPGALAQITTNLMMNTLHHAFEASQAGTVTVEIEPEAGGVLLVFRDSGRGIAQENLDHIFEPFFTTSRGTGGTGLGLHIVYNLTVNVLGGRLGCTSTPGKGTEFRFSLPLQAPGSPVPHTSG